MTNLILKLEVTHTIIVTGIYDHKDLYYLGPDPTFPASRTELPVVEFGVWGLVLLY